MNAIQNAGVLGSMFDGDGNVSIDDIANREDLSENQRQELMAMDLDNDGTVTRAEVELITSQVKNHARELATIVEDQAPNMNSMESVLVLDMNAGKNIEPGGGFQPGQPGSLTLQQLNGCYQQSKASTLTADAITFVYVNNGTCTFSGAGPRSAPLKEKWQIVMDRKTQRWKTQGLALNPKSGADKLVWTNREEPGRLKMEETVVWTRIRSKDAVGRDQSQLLQNFMNNLDKVNFFGKYKPGTAEHTQRLASATGEWVKRVSQMNSPRSPSPRRQPEGNTMTQQGEDAIAALVHEMRLMRQEMRDLKEIVLGAKPTKPATAM